MNEDRMVELESKMSFQEEALQSLSDTVYRQQKQIDRLEAVCQSLIEHIKDLSLAVAEGHAGAGGGANERPPHY
ncbi:MAG: SlyX family protein [Burkholderiales bacterium]